MSRWNFLDIDTNGNLVPFENKNLIPFLEKVIVAAAETKVPKPDFSNYFVKCAALVVSRSNPSEVWVISVALTPRHGGNIEYGLCQALHGEESIVTVLRSKLSELGTDPDLRKYQVLLSFDAKFELEKVPTCCGNCRDIMRDNFSPDAKVFSGNSEGGKVVVARLEHLLVDSYDMCSGFLPFKMAISTIREGQRLTNDIYSPDSIHSRRKYFASIRGDRAYFGARHVMCEYHPIYPLEDAVRQAIREGDPCFSFAIVVSKDDGSLLPPDVMYRDRQHLLELNFQQECLLGREIDPIVYLLTYGQKSINSKPRFIGHWKTTVKRWLPYPFTPSAFGAEFVAYATGKYKARRELLLK